MAYACTAENCYYPPGSVKISTGMGGTHQTLLYGHVADIQVEAGLFVTPHTIIGFLDSYEEHLHLEIIRSDRAGQYMVNPLPYFSPELQANLLDVAEGQTHGQRVQFHSGTKWQTPYDQPVLRREAGWIYEE